MQERYISETCCQCSMLKIFLRAQNITEKISIKNKFLVSLVSQYGYLANRKNALTDGFEISFIYSSD